MDRLRAALRTFFLWLQEHFPEADRLDAVSRSIAQSYAQHLAEQVAAGHYSKNYRADLYSSIHRFFDFVIDEHMETSPARNPFSPRDLPRRPDMIPRYIPDQELRKVLAYCEREATLFERTLVLTLLHTGIRSLEFTRLKASNIVQIGGVWKLHIHEGKGLKDRLIPLTAQCLAALQDWQKHGWERFGQDHRDSTVNPFIEGAWMTKHDGRYYLQYAAPGTEYNVYSTGVYVSDSPLGPFKYQPSNPLAFKTTGFMMGAGHGSTFQVGGSKSKVCRRRKTVGTARADKTLKLPPSRQPISKMVAMKRRQLGQGSSRWLPNP